MLATKELKYDKCRKIMYESRSKAKKAVKKINAQCSDMNLKDVYLCDICQCWHTTSMTKTSSRNYNRYKRKK